MLLMAFSLSLRTVDANNSKVFSRLRKAFFFCYHGRSCWYLTLPSAGNQPGNGPRMRNHTAPNHRIVAAQVSNRVRNDEKRNDSTSQSKEHA
ncbi:hypothetical protein [Bifidobacterium simiarum]|uniref:hypothetical protein n=1 Tax=Bifidobacterium simiarum TaxID=2045441 RepID=UPI001BDBE37C|nr:hypothetical protein [Bifidobacterium simiarum]MBT1165652.1 hypothetical protein [Bifidobacterium simiarum]